FSGIVGDCATITTQPASVEVTPGAAITGQPMSSQTVCVGGSIPAAFTVSYSGGTGTPTYQWYSNSVDSASGGTPVGTNSPSYLPPAFTSAGTHSYYVTVQLSANGCAPATS